MRILDWVIVVGYALLVIGMGVVSSRRDTADEYFRGAKKLPWWALGLSIIATAFSAGTLLGAPGEGFRHGFLWLQLQLGDLLGYGLVCLLFLPVFLRLDITTAYDYLELRFDKKVRLLGATAFLLFVLVRLGGLLYGAAIVFAKVTGFSVETAIVLVGILSIFYTAAGGLAAVVWTDVLQFAMVLFGVGLAAILAVHGVPGGWSEVLAAARRGGRLTLIDPVWNPSNLRSLPTAIFGYGILAFAVAGTNQQSVQRYVSCRDVRSSIKAALLGWGAGAAAVAATLGLGVVLYAYSLHHPEVIPPGTKRDEIFPRFIGSVLPPGAAGILVAAVFAAAMSSIDSALHSLATSFVVDFQRTFKGRAGNSDGARKETGTARITILVAGVFGIGAALFAARSGEALLPYLVKFSGYTLGPLLGLFLLAALCERTNGNGAFWGTLVALGIVMLWEWKRVAILGVLARGAPSLSQSLSVSSGKIPGFWYPAITAPLALVFGYLLSLPFPAPDRERIRRYLRFDRSSADSRKKGSATETKRSQRMK
ncbi:MAG: sodium-coupled permease [Candidatus Hydrogenedentota bacterium]|nr:MAG: sodium-coupled permease [Candidatus Hydrogenedentota bacterium]